MGFDVYHSVGPQVDVSLFGDAARTGATLGKAIPSFIESAVQGTEQGIEFGQQAAARYQESEIRQHQIDQQPVIDRQQAAQAQNAETVARLNEIKLANEQKLNSLSVADDEAKLTNESQRLNEEIALRAKRKDFLSSWGSADSKGKADLVGSGKYSDVFAADKDLFNQSLGYVYQDPKNGLDESQRESIGQLLKVRTIQSQYQKDYDKHLSTFNSARDALPTDDLTTSLLDDGKMGGIPAEQYPFNVDFKPAGKYLRDSSGNFEKDGYGAYVQDPKWENVSDNKWDVITKDGRLVYDGTHDFQNITSTASKLYKQYVTSASYINREQERLAIQHATASDKSPSNNQQTAEVDVPALGKTASKTEPKFYDSPEDKLWADLAKSLDVPADAGAKVKAPLADLSRQVTNYADTPSLRNSPAAITRIGESITSVARSVSDAQFQTNPVVKQQFNEEAVASYNRGLLAKLNPNSLTRTTIGGRYTGAPLSINYGLENSLANQGMRATPEAALYDAYKVSTPEELYFVTQQQALERQIHQSVYGSAQKGQQRQQQPVNAQIAKKNRNDILFGKAVSGR